MQLTSVNSKGLTLSEVDTTDLDKFEDPNKANFMEKFVIPEAIATLKSTLKVESTQIIPKFSPFGRDSKCNELNQNGELVFSFRSNHHKKGLQADFLLYVGVVNRPEEFFFAKATFCIVGEGPGYGFLTSDDKTHRPLVGIAIFNESLVKFDNGNSQAQVATFVHEVLHALYFHPKLFIHFPRNSDNQSFMFRDDKGIWKLRGDNVLYFLRRHLDCPSADGGTRVSLY